MILGAYVATRSIPSFLSGDVIAIWSSTASLLLNGILGTVIVAATLKVPGVIENALGIGGRK